MEEDRGPVVEIPVGVGVGSGFGVEDLKVTFQELKIGVWGSGFRFGVEVNRVIVVGLRV